MSNPKIARAIELVTMLNAAEHRDLLHKDRKERIKKLVDEHGVELVSVAAGLSLGTLLTYMNAKTPKIGEKAVAQAEYVIKKL